MTLLEAALDLHYAALAVVPVATDGSKRPAVNWKTYQTDRPTEAELRSWFAPVNGSSTYDGLGVLTGLTSGNLEMLEVEGRAAGLVEELAKLMADHGMAELWDRLCAGYLEQSPSGGLHWLYRVDGPDGVCRPNTKLARRPGEQPGTVDVLIETRGEGGFTVTAPSAGRSHPTGQPWRLLAGRPATIPILTVDERDALYGIAQMLDQMPAYDGPPPSTGGLRLPAELGAPQGDRPGDDFNARADWLDILGPHGWQRTKAFAGGSWGWTRPGKEPRDGISATTGRTRDLDGEDRLYVFSSSTVFDTEQPYSKFAAYAVLEHAGDYAAAARRLGQDGYGTKHEPGPVLSIVPEPDRPTSAPAPSAPPSPPEITAAVQGSNVVQLRPEATTTVRDSEDAHAHRLITTYGDLIRYCAERGRWLVWDGGRWAWQPPSGGEVREYAKKVARALTKDDADKGQRRRALSAAGISGCLKQAETDARIAVSVAQLDADPWQLNTPAGVVDLRTGQVHPPDPTSLCTKTTTVAPAALDDPGTWDAAWTRFLDDTFGVDQAGREIRDYVQRLVGLTLIGEVREQLLAFLHGLGANGKSTLAETLMHALGVGETGYAIAAPAEMLMIRKHSEHPAELAQLAGARMVVCSELDDGQRFAEAKIKQLTGRDSINARFLYGQPFTFSPSHTIWLLGNHRPQARTGGLAFWRRVKMIEFAHVVPVELRDPALGDRLNAAAGTVLAWAIAGAVDYLAHGIREPATVTRAVESYAADQDTIGRFVDDVCHRADSELVRIGVGHLRAKYEAFCREIGEEPSTARRLTQELQDRFGVGSAKSMSTRWYTRITVLEQDDDSDTEALSIDHTGPAFEAPPILPGLS